MILKPVKTILKGLDGTVKIIGIATNLTLVAGFAWVANEFYGKASIAWNEVGNMPALTAHDLAAWVADPAALTKVISAGSVWVYGIIAAGCAWMTILGLRWSYHMLIAIIQNLKMQADKASA